MINGLSNMTRANFLMQLYLVILYIMLIIINKNSALYSAYEIQMSNKNKKIYRVMLAFMILMLITHFYETDYFSYMEIVKNYNFFNISENHGEPIYAYIIYALHKNYLLFRLVVWGGALYITTKIFKLYSINVYFGTYVLLSMYMSIHFISRASLAFAIYFFGISLVFYGLDKNIRRLIILGVLILISSYFFHRSAVLLIIITPIFLVPMDRNKLFGLLFITPIIIYAIRFSFMQILIQQSIHNDEIMHKMSAFATTTGNKANFMGIVRYFFEWGILYFPFAVIAIAFYKNMSYIKKHRKMYLNLFKIMLMIIIIATTFGLMKFDSIWLFKRTLFMATIPMVILLSGLYKDHIIGKNLFRFIINIATGYNIFVYMYSAYVTLK